MSHSSTVIRDTVSDMPYTRLQENQNSDSEDLRLLQQSNNCSSHLLNNYHEKYIKNHIGHIKGPVPEESYKAYGFKSSSFKLFIFYLFTLLSFGLLHLVAYWRPDWKTRWTKRKCDINEANEFILEDTEGTVFVVQVQEEEFEGEIPVEYNTSDDPSKRSARYFVLQYLKYVWNRNSKEFECLTGLSNKASVQSLLSEYRGYSLESRDMRYKLFGANCITVVVKSYTKLLFTEILHPFYIFQGASLALWAADQYYLYAICIFLITCLSIGVSLFETRKQSENLKSMVDISNTNSVLVLRSPGALIPVEEDARNVVPGDVIVIPSTGCIMACDAVLILGTAIVNESMLTGESVPVTKTNLTVSDEGEIYNSEKHKRHTLFCGTSVIQTRYYGNEQVLAVVVRTGFSTAKGELVRSILFPRSIVFKFYDASMKFIQFMFVISSIGMSYSLYLHLVRDKPIVTTIIRTLDIVTIVVPPALPAAMTVGTYYAQNRLKKMGIFCISPPRINVCGKLKLVCFDKTGTLTEDGLQVWGVVEVEKRVNGKLVLGSPRHQVDDLDPKSSFTASLASCHSLTYINGQLTGDPLDIQMFESTKWDLVEPEKDNEIFDSLIPTIVRPPSKKLLSHRAQVTFVNSGHKESDPDPKFAPEAVNGLKNVKNEESKVFPIMGVEVAGNAQVGENHIAFVCQQNNGVGAESVDEVDLRKNTQPSITIEQVLVQLENEQRKSDEIASSIVKPFVSETLVEIPGLKNIAETSFKVPYEIGIVRQFPFSSTVQRMSVIVRVLGRPHMELYCKGAPEVIQHLCNPDTIPENFSSVLNQFTVQGFRVIALAHKNLESKLSWHSAQRIKRDKVEKDLTFLGLLILQNVLKPETTPVITQMKTANIRTVMITGDNILTGICVARDCGMVDKSEKVLLAKVAKDDDGHYLTFDTAHSGGFTDSIETSQEKNTTRINMEKGENYHIAISGQCWTLMREYFPEYIKYVVAEGTVFARMSPEQKVQVVEEFQNLNYVVGMCGDGANDCGALKAAHVGISLSEAEASVAAPFTSRVPNITCVPNVICEGRGALTTNFSVFKYMALYSIIQFVSILILYTACTNLSDPQFLYIDLFIVTLIAIFMGHTKPNYTLVPERPLSNLIGSVNMFSILSQIFFVIATQILAYYYLKIQPWYDKPNDCSDPNSDNEVKTWETNVIFCVSSFQYLALAVIYSPGHPFRKSFFTNIWLTITLVVLFLTTSWLLLYPFWFVGMIMQLLSFPSDPLYVFRGTLFLIAILHFVAGWSLEYFVAGSTALKRVFQFIWCKKRPKNLYKRVKLQINEDENWPPMERPIYEAVSTT
ncbi:UNVERIFIED_CONTAM: hypothetical protein RMT77_017795 [Armadillidium vulgare]